MAVADVSAVGYFMPILAFLLVFIVIYALLKKTQVLGEAGAAQLFISFIIASFFVMEASLVDFVRFNSAWFGVGAVLIFFLFLLLAFLPGDKTFWFLDGNKGFAWVLLGIIVAFFVISSAYVFHWAVNWEAIDNDWFGFILLLVIAGVVSWRIK